MREAESHATRRGGSDLQAIKVAAELLQNRFDNEESRDSLCHPARCTMVRKDLWK